MSTEQQGTNECPRARSLTAGDLVADRFRVLGLLGEGAIGEVWEAEDAELGCRVALKALKPAVASEPGVAERFRREVRLAQQISHPHVCRIHDLFIHRPPGRRRATDGPVPVVSMELLAGETLAERLAREGRLPAAEAVAIAVQVTSALAAGHAAGVVHRDLKSSNIVLVESPAGLRAVVTDFGLARSLAAEPAPGLTASGDLLGSPAYMAPEQLRGGAITPATDLYALGVVLYEMVTGRLPFEGETALATALRRLEAPAESPRRFCPELDPRLEAVILRCLEREPAARFASAAELAAALLPPPAPAPSPRPRARRMLRGVAAGGLLAAALASAFLWRRPASPPAPRASSELEAGLTLAGLEIDGGRPREALAAIAALRRLGESQASDPRIDLAEARAAQAISDLRRQEDAAERARVKARNLGAEGLEAEALALRGQARFRLGDPRAALSDFEAAGEITRRTGDLLRRVRLLRSWAAVLTATGGRARGEEMLREVLASTRALGDRSGEVMSLSDLAQSLADRGELLEARSLLGEARALAGEIRSPAALLLVERRLGSVLRQQGELGPARAHFEAALALAEELGNHLEELRLENSLAFFDKIDGDLEGAERHLRAAADGFAALGDEASAAGAATNLGIVLLAQGRLAEAEERHGAALALYRELGARDKVAEELHRRAEVFRYQGKADLALREHRQALAERQELSDRGAVARSELAIARLLLDGGRGKEAAEMAGQAAREFERAGARDFAGQALTLAALATLADGRPAEAERLTARARPLVAASGDATVSLFSAMVEAELAASHGEARRGVEQLQAALGSARGADLPLVLEARLTLARLALRAGEAAPARAAFTALASEAEAMGVGLVAGQARAALAALP